MRKLVGHVDISGDRVCVERGDKPAVEIPLSEVRSSCFVRSYADPEDGALELCTGSECYSISVSNEDGPVFLSAVRDYRAPHEGEAEEDSES